MDIKVEGIPELRVISKREKGTYEEIVGDR